jgi:transcriptional regulator with XRE-family HTH domain
MSERHWSPEAARAQLIREKLAENVRRERERCGFTQETLGTASLLRRGTIVQLERAEGERGISTLGAIAIALQVPLQELLAGFRAAELVEVCAARSAAKGCTDGRRRLLLLRRRRARRVQHLLRHARQDRGGTRHDRQRAMRASAAMTRGPAQASKGTAKRTAAPAAHLRSRVPGEAGNRRERRPASPGVFAGFPRVPGCFRTMNVSGSEVRLGFPKRLSGVRRSFCGPDLACTPSSTYVCRVVGRVASSST